MALLDKKYYHNIDLDSNELKSGRVYNLTTLQRLALPLNTTHKGYIVYDITLLSLFIWDGTTWTTNSSSGTITSISAGTGMNFTTITASGSISIDITKVPYMVTGFTNGFLKWNGSAWVFDNSTYLTGITSGQVTTALGYTPATDARTLTINGTSQDLTSNRTWNVGDLLSSGSYSDPSWITSLAYSKLTGAPTIPIVGTWGALNYPTWTTGTPFVKMTAAGTFSLDLSTYITSAVTSISATGPITVSGSTGSVNVSTLMSTNKLIGRSSTGAGVMEEITLGTGLTLSAGTLNATISNEILKGTASGTDTYTVTITGPSSYANGDAYLIRFTNGNTTGATLNINGLGAITLYRNNDGPVIGGDIWNGAEMLCIYNSTTGGFQLIGTSPNAMYAYITNADSVTITKGQVVYAFGGQGDRMTVKLANNVGDSTSAQTVGVVLSTSIAANQKGVIITQGLLDGLSILPTATYNDGDPLYLGSTPGSITKVKPYAPNHLVYLGNVTTASNGAAGRWYVRIQNGYELDELHNVQAQSPTLKDTLWYDNTVSPAQWKTASIASILGYTPISADESIANALIFG
jgi:hypothetical protein